MIAIENSFTNLQLAVARLDDHTQKIMEDDEFLKFGEFNFFCMK